MYQQYPPKISRTTVSKDEWGIFEGGHLYIKVTFSTRKQAELELEDLLKPYAEDHAWRKLLNVAQYYEEEDTCRQTMLPPSMEHK